MVWLVAGGNAEGREHLLRARARTQPRGVVCRGRRSAHRRGLFRCALPHRLRHGRSRALDPTNIEDRSLHSLSQSLQAHCRGSLKTVSGLLKTISVFIGSPIGSRSQVGLRTGVPHSQKDARPYDTTVGLCLGSKWGPRDVGIFLWLKYPYRLTDLASLSSYRVWAVEPGCQLENSRLLPMTAILHYE